MVATIPANETSVTFSLTPVDDDVFEGDEKVHAILKASSLYWLSTQTEAEATIADNDIDLAIDSNNDGRFGKADDAVEDITGDDARPGKVVLISDSDSDRDGIPDFADGFDLTDELTTDDVSAGSAFAPIRFAVAEMGSSAQLRITYDASDPAEIEATLSDPHVLPAGTLRLWRKDGWQARDMRSATVGGDYLAPGVYTAAQLGLGAGGYATFYVEATAVSEAVADATVLFEFKADSSATAWKSDQVRLTATRIEIQGKGYGESEFREVERLIASDLSIHPDANGGFTRGAYETHKIRVFDPRGAGVTSITLDRQPLPLSRHGAHYETDEFIGVISGVPVNWYLPYPRINIDGNDVRVRYNPMTLAGAAPKVKELTEHRIALAEAIEEVVAEMEAEGWQGAANDDGAFGKEVHRRASIRLPAADAQWKADIYVRAGTRQIVSIGQSPPGGVTGTIQVDLLRVREGQNIAVGQIFDPEKLDDLVEIKTSIGGKIDPDQRDNLKGLMNGGDIVVTNGTARKWTPARGWHGNAKFKNALKVLGLFGAAGSVWAVINVDRYDEEFDALVARAKFISERAYTPQQGGEDQKRLDMIEWQRMVADYVRNFTPDGTAIGLAQLRSLYETLDMDFDD